MPVENGGELWLLIERLIASQMGTVDSDGFWVF